MGRQNRIVSALAVTLLGLAALTQANIAESAIVDYNIIAPTTGSIYYNGGNTALYGTGISVDSLIGSGMLVNGGTTLSCVNCSLDFSTGNYYGTNSYTNAGITLTDWLFNGGGNISLTGSIVDSSNNTVVANGTLFSGNFSGAATLQLATNSFTLSVAAGAFSGTNGTDLLNYFGLPVTGSSLTGGMLIGFTPVVMPAVPTVGTAFASSSISSGYVTNNITNTVVPLPAAAWLFISGLMGLGVVRRRMASV